MKRIAIALTMVAVAGIAPADAVVTVGYYAHRIHVAEVGQNDGAPIEVRLQAYTGEVLANSEPESEPLTPSVCVDLFRSVGDGGIGSSACGEIEVTVQPALSATHLRGAIDGSAWSYANDPEYGPVFTDLGPTQVVLDLTLTGTGDARLAEPTTAPGVCGLPPDIRGALVILEAPMTRDAVISGALSEANVGSVDAATTSGRMTDTAFATADACLEV